MPVFLKDQIHILLGFDFVDLKEPNWGFSAKNYQFSTFLKTWNPTRVPGFFKIKTRNPVFQNPARVPNHYLDPSLIPTYDNLNLVYDGFSNPY